MASNFFEDTKRERGEVKHAILKYYMGAFLGRMGQYDVFDQVIYVDGFAGPGEYSNHGNTEDGLPLVAIKALIGHMHFNKLNKVFMYFIEYDLKHFKKLETILKKLQSAESIDPEKVSLIPMHGKFVDKMKEILDKHASDGEYGWSPMLVFADPFGMKDVPFNIIQHILNRDFTDLLM